MLATHDELLLFSRSGFTPALRHIAGKRGDAELVVLHRMYHGQ